MLRCVKTLLKKVLPSTTTRFLRNVISNHKEAASYRHKLRRYLKISTLVRNDDPEFCLSMLRMYAHILDKGLHRQDWEPNHGNTVYKEAKRFLVLSNGTSDPTFHWGKAVLLEYERRSLGNGTDINQKLHEHVVAPPITPQQLMQHVKYRTSIRSFEQRRITEEDAKRIAEAALEAPSSCHRQTLRIYATTDPECAPKVGSCFHGFAGFSAFVPAFFVFCVDLRPYSFPAELFTPTLDTGLAVENALLMASSLGISMTLLNWTGKSPAEERLRSYLGMAEHEAVVVGAACGYPGEAASKPARKAISSTLVLK